MIFSDCRETNMLIEELEGAFKYKLKKGQFFINEEVETIPSNNFFYEFHSTPMSWPELRRLDRKQSVNYLDKLSPDAFKYFLAQAFIFYLKNGDVLNKVNSLNGIIEKCEISDLKVELSSCTKYEREVLKRAFLYVSERMYTPLMEGYWENNKQSLSLKFD